jgi:hypothetical protein
MFSSQVAQAQSRSPKALSQLGAAERRRKPVRPAQTPSPPIAQSAAEGCNASAGKVDARQNTISYQLASPSMNPPPSPAYGARGKHQQINARERHHTLSRSVRRRSDGLFAEVSSIRLRSWRSVGCRSLR